MAYTFGSATGDDITFTGALSAGATTNSNLLCGWFYPTTLTATRGLWSFGTIYGAEIDTTTSELRLRTDNTTDGQWTTSGLSLVTNEWRFLAFFGTQLNGTPSAAWRVWAGTVDTAPSEITVAVATAPVGNFTGNAALTIGNKGSAGVLAFQGDIDDVAFIQCSQVASAVHGFGLATLGAVANDEAANILRYFVTPIWAGIFPPPGPLVCNITTQPMDFGRLDLSTTLPQVLRGGSSSATIFAGITPTISGATPSQQRGPRIAQGGINHPAFKRR